MNNFSKEIKIFQVEREVFVKLWVINVKFINYKFQFEEI